MFCLSLPEVIGILVGLITIFSAVVGGIGFLIKAFVGSAIEKGDAQADAIKEDIQEMGAAFTTALDNVVKGMNMMNENLSSKIELNDKASRDRGENLNKRLNEHNENVMTHIEEVKAQQNRQLQFIREVNDDVKSNKDITSKVSNRVSRIEGEMRAQNG